MKITRSARSFRYSIDIIAEILLLTILLLSCPTASVSAENVVDHLSVPGPLIFNKVSYQLVWSAHPSPHYYKQEYLPVGQSTQDFQGMVLVEAVIQGTDVNSAVAAQVDLLNRRKATDPTVNFAISKNPKTREMVIDFVMGKDSGEKGSIVEWNAYRYAPLTGNGGKSGVLLFGISRRAYGENSTEFLRGLKSARTAELDALVRFRLPAVDPKN